MGKKQTLQIANHILVHQMLHLPADYIQLGNEKRWSSIISVAGDHTDRQAVFLKIGEPRASSASVPAMAEAWSCSHVVG